MQLHALSKELELEPTKASRLLTKLGYGNSFPNELDGDMELHLRTVNDMLNRGFTINDAVGVVKRQIDGLDADDPEEPPPPPVRFKKRGRPKGSKNKSKDPNANKTWDEVCWEAQLRRWEDNPSYPIGVKINYLQNKVVRTEEQEQWLKKLQAEAQREERKRLSSKPIPIWEAMNKAVEETVDKAPKDAPEDTKEGLKQLLLDICLNLVSQQDARAFEANKERCLSLLRRNNAGQPLTVN